MATSFDTKYKKNIEGLAKANNVDLSTAGAMLRSNLAGTTSYKGGGVLDYGVANADLKASRDAEVQLPASGSARSTRPARDDSSYATAIQKAFEAKNKALQDGLNTQLGEIKQSSDDNRSNVYVNSRLSAIGNNEQLASQGLAGGLYGSPMSGKSESSRINENVALGNNINAVNRQQTSLENNAKNTIGSQIADNQLQMAQTIAQLRQQERESQKAEYASTIGAYAGDYQQEINRLKAMGYTDDDYEVKVLNQARQQKISGIAQSQAEAEQQAFENQLKLMETQYKVNKPYYKPGSDGTTTMKSALSSTDIKNIVSDPKASTALKDAKKKLDNGDIDQQRYNQLVKSIDSGSKIYSLRQINTQYGNGGLNPQDYAKYVSMYYGSDDMNKVNQMVNGLGTYMMSGGGKEAVVKQVENAFFNGGLTINEANAILQKFGIAGI